MKIRRISNSIRGKKYSGVNKCILLLDENITRYYNIHGSIVTYFTGEKLGSEMSQNLKSRVLVCIRISTDVDGFSGVFVKDGTISL